MLVVAAIAFTAIVLPAQLTFGVDGVDAVLWLQRAAASRVASRAAAALYAFLDAILLLDIGLTFKMPGYNSTASSPPRTASWPRLRRSRRSYGTSSDPPHRIPVGGRRGRSCAARLVRKWLRYIAALTSGREAEAHLFVGLPTRLLQLGLSFFLALHWYACAWWLIYKLGDPNLNWVAANGIAQASPPEQYLYALYKAAAILVAFGYGNIPPQTSAEVGLTLTGMLSGVVMLALITASIVSITSEVGETDRVAQRRLRIISDFLAAEACPPDLRRRVRRHMEYVLLGQRAISADEALTGVSDPLRAEIALFRCREMVQRVPFLSADSNPDAGFIKRLVMQLVREAFSPGDRLMEEGEVAASMYFLASGRVAIHVNKGAKLVTTLSAGSYIGEIALLYSLSAEQTAARRVEEARGVARRHRAAAAAAAAAAGSSTTGADGAPPTADAAPRVNAASAQHEGGGGDALAAGAAPRRAQRRPGAAARRSARRRRAATTGATRR